MNSYSTLEIFKNSSVIHEDSGIVISVKEISALGDKASFIAGFPGLPNVEKKNSGVGEAVIFETPNGTFEVRIFETYANLVNFLISKISPQKGFTGGFYDGDVDNLPFSEEELSKISNSIQNMTERIQSLKNFTPEQKEFIELKISEIANKANQFGRKDFINWFAGSLTSLCISAAFAPEQAKALFNEAGKAFNWLFENAPLLFM